MEIPYSPIKERLNNRRFTVAGHTHGLSGEGTVFYYPVEGDAIGGTYQVRPHLRGQSSRTGGLARIPLSFFIIA